MIGRVVDALGRPIDGLSHRNNEKRPVENEATWRYATSKCKTTALPTGLKVVDALVPIVKGNELIIGDRKLVKQVLQWMQF